MAEALSYALFRFFNHFHLWCHHQNAGIQSQLKYTIMNYLQAVKEITDVVPDFEKEVKEIKIQNSYSIIRTFTERIKNMIRQNDRNMLFRSLQKMDKIYTDGDTVLKNAIETTFIYSLDNCTAFCSEEYRKVIFSHISANLQKVYSRQIYSHGI